MKVFVNNIEPPSLAEAIAAIRARRGETMAAFGLRIGCKQSTVSQYEAGNLIPSPAVLLLLLQLADNEGERSPILETLGPGYEAVCNSFKRVVKNDTSQVTSDFPQGGGDEQKWLAEILGSGYTVAIDAIRRNLWAFVDLVRRAKSEVSHPTHAREERLSEDEVERIHNQDLAAQQLVRDAEKYRRTHPSPRRGRGGPPRRTGTEDPGGSKH